METQRYLYLVTIMAKHSVTTSGVQERALLALLAIHNQRLASSIPPQPAINADQFFELLAQPLLAQILEHGAAATSDDVVRALKAAIESGQDAKINAVKAALGLT